MRRIAVIVMAVVLGAAAALAAGFRNIPSTEAQRLLAAKKNVLVVDVRTPDEYRQARLKGAALIPLGDLERRLGEIPRNRPVLVYCTVGARSGRAAGILAGKGYGEVYNLADGIVGWYQRGLPIEQ